MSFTSTYSVHYVPDACACAAYTLVLVFSLLSFTQPLFVNACWVLSIVPGLGHSVVINGYGAHSQEPYYIVGETQEEACV